MLAPRKNFNIDQGVARELFHHMVEKSDTGRDFGDASAVEIDASLDIGFLGLT